MQKRTVKLMLAAIAACGVLGTRDVCTFAAQHTEVSEGDMTYIEHINTSETAKTPCQVNVSTVCPENFGLNTVVILTDDIGQMYRIILSEENGYTDKIYLAHGTYMVYQVAVADDNTSRYPFIIDEDEIEVVDGTVTSISYKLADYDRIEGEIADKLNTADSDQDATESTYIVEDLYDTNVKDMKISLKERTYYYDVTEEKTSLGNLAVYGTPKADIDLVVKVIKPGVIGEAECAVSYDGGKTVAGQIITSDTCHLENAGVTLRFHTPLTTDEYNEGDRYSAHLTEAFEVSNRERESGYVAVSGHPTEDYKLAINILSDGKRGVSKYTLSLDEGETTLITDTIPDNGIVELSNGLVIFFGDGEYTADTVYSADIKSNEKSTDYTPFYILIGIVAAAGINFLVVLMSKREDPNSYRIKRWKDRQEVSVYEQ